MQMFADTAISSFPGHVISDMETGGLCFNEDGEIVDIAEIRHDPDRSYFDPNNADSGYIGVNLLLDDEEKDPLDDILDDDTPVQFSSDNELFIDREYELGQLIAEQSADDDSRPVVYSNKSGTGKRINSWYDDDCGARTNGTRGRNNRYKNHKQVRPTIELTA